MVGKKKLRRFFFAEKVWHQCRINGLVVACCCVLRCVQRNAQERRFAVCAIARTKQGLERFAGMA
jgi:hypothetical protein